MKPITVTSVVGRFLEHARLYYFRNGGQEELFLGSADLMPRNLDRRVELLFPIESPHLRKVLVEDLLHVALHDNAKVPPIAVERPIYPSPARARACPPQLPGMVSGQLEQPRHRRRVTGLVSLSRAFRQLYRGLSLPTRCYDPLPTVGEGRVRGKPRRSG